MASAVHDYSCTSIYELFTPDMKFYITSLQNKRLYTYSLFLMPHAIVFGKTLYIDLFYDEVQ